MIVTALDEAMLSEQTTLLMAGIMCLVLPLVMTFYRQHRETYPGFGIWVGAFLCAGIGCLLVGLDDLVPVWVSVWLGNVFILAFPALLALGLNVFLNRPPLFAAYSASIAIYAALQGLSLVTGLSAGFRSALFTVFVFFYVVRLGFNIYRYTPHVLGRHDKLTLTVIAFGVVIVILRFVNLLFESVYENSFVFDDVDTIFIILLVLASVAMVIATISLNQLRLEFNLRTTSQELQEQTIALEKSNDKLAQLALTDFLTGLKNVRFFDSEYKKRWENSTTSGTPLSIILLDVDCFKLYNDSLGHLAGDECLKRIGEVLLTYPGFHRGLVARIGGEEFAIVMENNAEQALEEAERIVAIVEHLSIPHPSSLVGASVTVTAGVATRSSLDSSREKLLSRADYALYQAKSLGRNRAMAA